MFFVFSLRLGDDFFNVATLTSYLSAIGVPSTTIGSVAVGGSPPGSDEGKLP